MRRAIWQTSAASAATASASPKAWICLRWLHRAVAAREELRETDKKETRVLIQTHPDVLVLPPDPPQLLVKLGQVRSAHPWHLLHAG